MTQIHSFQDLMVWHKARSLAKTVYTLTGHFPKYEIFGLTIQMRRCAVSIVANIAEGSARRTSGALANHLDIAIGSAAELLALTYVAEDVGYLEPPQTLALIPQIQEVTKMLNGLHLTICRKVDGS
jgi:four helix bundle protein